MRWIAALLTTPIVAGLVVAIRFTGALQLLEWAIYDQYFQLRATESIDQRIVLVTIGESDISALGQWPLSDATLAQLMRNLNQHQPAVIGLDLYRDLPVEPGSQDWLEVMASTPNLIGVEKAIGRTVAPPAELERQGQVALTDLLVDADGKFRRGLLSHPNGDDQLRLGLGAELAVRYLEKKEVPQEVVDAEQKIYRLGQAILQPLRGNDGGYIRTNAGGYQILINFRGHAHHFPRVSVTDVLNNDLEPALIRDRIVIVGGMATSLNDLFYTPYSSRLINTPEATAGMVIHANLASTLVSAALDGRAVLRVWPEPIEVGWIMLWSGLGALGYWWLLEAKRHSKDRFNHVVVGIVSVVLASGFLMVSSYLAFLGGWWIPVVPPFLALIGSASVITGYEIIKLQQYRAELAQQNLKLEKDKIRAEAASQAKSQFLAKMSHEFRTPLNAILGFTQLMNQDPSLTAQQQKSLDIINLSGEHLLNLINDILEISKIEANRVVLHKTNVDLYSLLDMLKAMLESKALAKGLQLQFERSPNVPQFVTADEGKLRQVLINLLDNAIKFTQVGSVILRLSETVKERSKIMLHFKIEDTGSGIAEDDVSKLFEIFTQGKVGQTFFDGVGLGLPISQQLVKLMGGEITVKTVVNQGTTFQFDIPASLEPSPQTNLPPIKRVKSLAADQEDFRILIADDEPISRKLLNKLLTSLGFQTREATNGQEAVELWESWHPHFIWMDVQMPIMNGWEATRQIRQKSLETNKSSPTIVAITANAFAEDRELSLGAGCDDFVSKPFRRDELLDKLSKYLGVRYQ
ncbi:CHASE2 domain-containing protein [Leptothoe spongobia]|uniref:Circadian input-output histidine kinase CikA n=1 Tax=Leptothoe spongobia TAU-MAC 1115 TaxID=1967444 RepID=A0A947GNE7_9CYAN|nr:CHASE2 domain-containing protein [Leptothoe spongobia]MBT9316001.1 CHASE2 domain-containing protein [Leptothoe spongobia TAU-MAC 1115]